VNQQHIIADILRNQVGHIEEGLGDPATQFLSPCQPRS